MPLTVADIMETDVPAVTPEDTVEAVLRVLRTHELPGVPVVNSGGRCVGIITEADLPVVQHGRPSGVVTRIDVLDALTHDAGVAER